MSIRRDAGQPIAVDSTDIERHIGFDLAVEAAEEAAAAIARGEVVTRRMTLPYENGWMRVMGALVPSLDTFGYKEFHLSGDGTVRYAIHLFAISDGRPIGVVDGAHVTPLRTAAAAAVACAGFFESGDSIRLAVVGSGTEARSGVRALNSVLTIKDVRVTSRSQENRDRCAAFVSEDTGLSTTSVGTVAEAVGGADLVYAATNSGGQVVLTRDDLRQVPFVASIGSTLPSQRELGGDVLTGAARVVVDTWDVLEESGDAIEALGLGLDRDRVLLLGEALPEPDEGGQVVYKSIGSPEQDVVLARRILDAAERSGEFGRRIEPLSMVKQNL